LIPGPRVLAATRAIVATGCYGPAGFDPRWEVPRGAEEVDGADGVRVAVREQVAAGPDWIKVHAYYRRARGAPATPTFSLAELEAFVERACGARRPPPALIAGARDVADQRRGIHVSPIPVRRYPVATRASMAPVSGSRKRSSPPSRRSAKSASSSVDVASE
jgi:hypothetical protein